MNHIRYGIYSQLTTIAEAYIYVTASKIVRGILLQEFWQLAIWTI